MSKLGLGIVGISILLATVAAWKVAKWKYQQEALQCEIDCKSELLKVSDQQKEIFTTNEKIIIKYKQIAEINRSLDIIELIDAL